jgi:dipeptidyl aminopeptidase/acylaminoacyl peptidase
VTVPGNVGFIPGIGNITWIDDNTVFVGVARKAHLSPWLLTLSDGRWTGPLNDRSVIFTTSTSDGPVWVGSSFSSPPCIYALRDGTVVTLVEQDHSDEYYAGESHWYTSFDGRKIQGWLLRNETPEAPLVVFCRGGSDAAVLSMWGTGIQEIVKAGYHVFAPNIRGSTTFGAEFENLKCGDVGGGDLQDVLYGARYAAHLLGTKRKPALVGGSYGGYLVLQALTVVPDEWAGGVAIVPIVDFVELYEQADPSYKTFIAHQFDGTLEEKPELYKDRSPITHIETLKSPVLVIAGENSQWCPPGIARKLCEKAQNMNLPVFLEVLEGENHGPSRVSHAIKTAVLELEFLEALF